MNNSVREFWEAVVGPVLDRYDPTRGLSRPNRYWTTTNVGEATPDVLSPMCWSLWGEPLERSWLYSMKAFGVLPRSASVSPHMDDWASSVFYGRLALNVDVIRATLAHLPGVDPDDFERDLCGSVRSDAPVVRGNRSRFPVIACKAPLTLWRQGSVIHRQFRSTSAWWRAEVFNDAETGRAPVDRLREAYTRFGVVFADHSVWRFVFAGAQSAVSDAARRAGDPALAHELMSGVGDVLETRMTHDVWRLAHRELSEEQFLQLWGYHGPNEGNPTAVVWRENPAPLRALAASYLGRTEASSPMRRAEQAIAIGHEAERRLLAASSPTKRPAHRWLLRRVRNIVRTLQVGKASYLMCVDGVRCAARDFGAEQVAAGRLASAEDAFYLSVPECVELSQRRLDDVAELIRRRRDAHAEYRRLALPIFFHGMPDPLPGSGAEARRERPATIDLKGSASGGGRVEGRARVLVDPTSAIALEPGDVLVCHFTDPSWAPLMALAEALVIDVGGSASHGAVVARELGIPYVIGTGNGTSLIRDGDHVVVDGTANSVRVVD